MQREKFRQMCKQTLVRVNIEILWLWKGYSDVERRGGGGNERGYCQPLHQTPTPTEGEKEVKMKEQGSGGNDGFRRQKIWKGKPIVCRDGLKLQLIFIWKWKGAAEIVGHNTQVKANSNVPLK